MDKQRIVISDVRLLSGTESYSIIIAEGIIESVKPGALIRKNNTRHIDGTDLLAFPGLTDLYSRLREPGLTRKGTIASESYAALRAGFTQVLCAPDTQPTIDNVATVELIRQRAAQSLGAQVLPIAALTVALQGEQLSELATLKSAGCPAAGHADYPLLNTNVLYSAMQYAGSFDLPLFMTPRDAQLAVTGCAHAGAMATRLGLPGIPVAAETVALARLLEICRETRCQLHVSRISSARGVEMIDAAKQAGLPVTCDVGIHHLYFTDQHLAGFDSSFHSAVPFRSNADRNALRAAVATGVIDAICSDHAPHDRDASLSPFPVTEPGLAAYDWWIPLVLHLPSILDLDLLQVVKKLSDAPRQIIGQPVATIAEGQPANLTLIDINKPVFCPDLESRLAPRGMNHPLNQQNSESVGLPPLHGSVRYTAHDGIWTDFSVADPD